MRFTAHLLLCTRGRSIGASTCRRTLWSSLGPFIATATTNSTWRGGPCVGTPQVPVLHLRRWAHSAPCGSSHSEPRRSKAERTAKGSAPVDDLKDVLRRLAETHGWPVYETWPIDIPDSRFVKRNGGSQEDIPGPSSDLELFEGLLHRTLCDIARQSPPERTDHASLSKLITLSMQDVELLKSLQNDKHAYMLFVSGLAESRSDHAVRMLGKLTTASEAPFNLAISLLLHILRRRSITPSALRGLVGYLDDHCRDFSKDLATYELKRSLQYDYRYQPESSTDKTLRPGRGTNRIALVHNAFTRLLRHSGRVWPEALEDITASYLSVLQAESASDWGALQTHGSDLAFFHNRLLGILASPSAAEPFKATPFREAAQACVLQAMSESIPPVLLNREGYRAVAQVQLSRKKTEDEQYWAGLKSPAWPPWKEEKTGMDLSIGPEHGVSNAANVLDRMQEAGFRPGPWEQAARIYAGWDTDSSPTVQTRTLFRDKDDHDVLIWAARIRCTRTLKEAWACFLAYNDSDAAPKQAVYKALFEKLVYDRRRLDAKGTTKQILYDDQDDLSDPPIGPLYPGDGKEVSPPPSSVHQETYTRTPPPTMQGLCQRMLNDQVQPTGDLLALLLQHLPFEQSWPLFLETATNDLYHQKGAVVPASNQETSAAAIPDVVFTAVIRCLCRVHRKSSQELRYVHRRTLPFKNVILDLLCPINHAYYLLTTSRRSHRPAWNAFLQALATEQGTRSIHVLADRPAKSRKDEEALLRLNAILAWHMALHCLDLMEAIDLTPDIETFKYLCYIDSTAVNAAIETMNEAKSMQAADDDFGIDAGRLVHFDSVLKESTHLRAQFFTMVSGSPEPLLDQKAAQPGSQSSDDGANDEFAQPRLRPSLGLPELLAVPSPYILHAYLRTLGARSCFEYMLELLRWMQEYWPELETRKAEDRAGERALRRVIVAVRAFCQFGHKALRTDVVEGEAASMMAGNMDLPMSSGDSASTDCEETAEYQRDIHRDGDEDHAIDSATMVNEGTGADRADDGKGRIDTGWDQRWFADEGVVQQMAALIESMPEWRGWATREEVELYMEYGKRVVRRMSKK